MVAIQTILDLWEAAIQEWVISFLFTYLYTPDTSQNMIKKSIAAHENEKSRLSYSVLYKETNGRGHR